MQRTTLNALVGRLFSLRREGIARKVDLALVRLKIDIGENNDAFNGAARQSGCQPPTECVKRTGVRQPRTNRRSTSRHRGGGMRKDCGCNPLGSTAEGTDACDVATDGQCVDVVR